MIAFRADSSDAKMLAALREHGLAPAPSGTAGRTVAGAPVPVDDSTELTANAA